MSTTASSNRKPGTSLNNPPPAPEPGQAQRLEAKLASGGGATPRTWALAFRGGDELMSGLAEFVAREGIEGGHLSGIGAFQSAQLAYFDRSVRDYASIPIDGQVECLALSGTIGLAEGKPLLHVHCVVGLPDGSVKGGHVVDAVVWPTMEVFLTEAMAPLPKTKDEESGLELFTFEDRA